METSSSDACQPPADGLHVDEQVMKSLEQNFKLLIAYMKVHYYLLYELHIITDPDAIEEEGTYRAASSHCSVS